MKRSNGITAKDYQCLLRLAGEMGEIPDGAGRRRLLLTRLGSMLGAHCNMLCRTGWQNGRYHLLEHQLEHDGRISAGLVKAYFSGEIPVDPMAMHMERQQHGHASLRVEAVADSAWYRSDHYQNYRRYLNLNDGVYGKIITPAGNVFGIAFIRDVHDGAMTKRHRELLRLCTETISSLLDLDRWPQTGIAGLLTPQLRAIARCYMAGMSAKQAARKLGLTDSTVREYTKIMHKRLNVSSRGELLALLFKNEVS